VRYAASEGFVYVTTGLLDVLESEDELATVLGHEIAHVSQRHQMKFIYAAYRRRIAGQLFGVVAGAALGAAMGSAAQSASSAAYAESATRQAVDLGFRMGEVMGNAMYVSMVEGYGKKQELEADALGIQYSRDAGYDPNGLVCVFKRLISVRDRLGLSRENYISNLMNAEPGLEARIKNIESPGSEETKSEDRHEEEP
jgi:predicted Zn-dependent protease